MNHDEVQCECKELEDKSFCKKYYMYNPSRCVCECNKTCKTGKYLDISN